jgi:hypothetical protein
MDPSPTSTPKRKHSQLSSTGAPLIETTRFTFEPIPPGLEDGSNSPRTKVAHKFRGLAIDPGSGGGVADDGPDASDSPDALQDHTALRKRIKTQAPNAKLAIADETPIEGPKEEWATGLQVAVDPHFAGAGRSTNRLQRAYPSINRLSESKSRRKRAGTPPLVGAKTKGDARTKGDPDAEIVEPIRASLTWHEDEITVYDPNDEDDDGTGINGIGFKPTPAMAYARKVKMKQQLAEYRKREESDARARRSQRRRGSPGPASLERTDSGSTRRVHFMEIEPVTVAIT